MLYKSNRLSFRCYLNDCFLLGNAYEEGQKTMESAWNIMEDNFWDENASLYKVESNPRS